MLVVELALAQGPKHSASPRRWLDPRAAFEGVWPQEVIRGTDNALGIFSMDYDGEGDAYSLAGHAYALDGTRTARWSSTHMFIDKQRRRATNRWEGDLLGPLPPTQSDKSGLTVLDLRRPPALRVPMMGDGTVLHVGEEQRIKFELRRVTPRLIAELGLPFTLNDLRLDAHGEESQLAMADLQARRHPAPLAEKTPSRRARRLFCSPA